MLSRIRRKNSINSQSAFCTRSAVSSLHFLMTGLVLLFLFERASSPDRNIGARKKILVRLSWPLWLMCGLYVEELPKYCTMIEQWLLYSNWRRTYNDYFIPTEDGRKCAANQCGYLWCSFAWPQRVMKWTRYGSASCEHFGFSIEVVF